jgi:hypothetical protein
VHSRARGQETEIKASSWPLLDGAGGGVISNARPNALPTSGTTDAADAAEPRAAPGSVAAPAEAAQAARAVAVTQAARAVAVTTVTVTNLVRTKTPRTGHFSSISQTVLVTAQVGLALPSPLGLVCHHDHGLP